MNNYDIVILDYLKEFPDTVSSSIFIGLDEAERKEVASKMANAIEKGQPLSDSDFIGDGDLI